MLRGARTWNFYAGICAQPAGGFLPGCSAPHFLQVRAVLVGEERLVERRQVAHQVLDLHLDAVHQAPHSKQYHSNASNGSAS